MIAHNIGSVYVLSDEEGQVLPSTDESHEITCALYIRDAKSGVYVATGSVYFQWDSDTGVVSLVESDSAIPENVSYQQDSATSFTFSLNSLPENAL